MSMGRVPPRAPFPEMKRQPAEPFGWLEASLLHEGWLAQLGPQATAVLVLLALAADSRGASYYGRDRMAQRLRLSRYEIDRALERILALRLAAFRPWREGQCDGVWQLLPKPLSPARECQSGTIPLSRILESIGFAPSTEEPRRKGAGTAE